MIPIYSPFFNEKNLTYAHRAIDSGWVSSQGEYLDLAKNKLKSMLGYKYVILTNNGTTATHLMAIALKFKHPHIKKLIVPNNVYVAAWNSFLYDKNYTLIPIDADLNTWNFDTNKISEKLDHETAILVVHNIGNVVNVSRLKKQFPTAIFIEDNCEGFLGKYENRYTGTDSFASTVSFFGNKTITSGEGGAFITSDREVFEHINVVKNQGQSNTKFLHHVLGYNYRMTNIQAALLYGQLEDVNVIVSNKQRIFSLYNACLSDNEYISFQKIEPETEHSLWMCGIKVKPPIDKKQMELYLFNNGIDTRPMFYDINSHEYLKNVKGQTMNAVALQKQCLILPSYPNLSDSQVLFICEKINQFTKT